VLTAQRRSKRYVPNDRVRKEQLDSCYGGRFI
jgi:hypothetical protein